MQTEFEEKATEVVKVRITPTEKSLLKERASLAEQNVSEYIRATAFGVGIDRQTVGEIIRAGKALLATSELFDNDSETKDFVRQKSEEIFALAKQISNKLES